MNNLNVPMQNISPNEREGSSDGSKWNYAFLVPMLGLAAYRWYNYLSAQKQQLVEKHRQQEQERINSEKAVWQSQARALMKELETSLGTRQHLYCSYRVSQTFRLELEEKMLSQAVTNPVAKELGIEDDLKYIFKHETHCANMQNSDKKQNGQLMWVFFKSWEDRIELQKLKKFKIMELGEKGN